MRKFLKTVGVLIALGLCLIAGLSTQEPELKDPRVIEPQIPCAQYGDYRLRDLPARCLEYYENN